MIKFSIYIRGCVPRSPILGMIEYEVAVNTFNKKKEHHIYLLVKISGLKAGREEYLKLDMVEFWNRRNTIITT